MQVISIGKISGIPNISNKSYRKTSHYPTNSCKSNIQISNQPTFKGKKLEFLLDVALAGAFSAATGFVGSGLGTAYLFHKYIVNNKNDNDDNE